MSIPLFVEADWLRAHLSDASVRIVDTRSTPHGAPGAAAISGPDQYEAGHIPGAIYLDYARDLQDPQTPYAVRVAEPQRFAEVLSSHGIGDAHTIVAYDDGTIPYAARMVWMCRYYGHDDVHILAGGFPAWKAAGGAVSSESPAFPAAVFTSRVRANLRASLDEVRGVAEGTADAQLLETQGDATYAMRDRDIPRSHRLSANLLLESARGGRPAPVDVLQRLAAERGLDPHKRTIVSCGSGVSASGAFLALTEAGFTDLAVYDGSWMEWSHHGLPTVPKKNAGA